MQSTSGCARASSSSIFLSVTDTSRRPIYLGGLSISEIDISEIDITEAYLSRRPVYLDCIPCT